MSGKASDTGKVAERDGYDESARAGNDEKDEGAPDALCPPDGKKEWGKHGNKEGQDEDGRGVPAGEASDESFRFRLMLG